MVAVRPKEYAMRLDSRVAPISVLYLLACSCSTETADRDRPLEDILADVEVAEVSEPAPACNAATGPVAGPWVRCAGGPFEDRAFAVAVAPSGEVIVVGATDGELRSGEVRVGPRLRSNSVIVRYDAAGRPLGARAFGGDRGAHGENDEAAMAVAVDAHGDLIVAGTFTGHLDFGGGFMLDGEPLPLGSTADRRDVYVVKLDPTATTVRWARSITALGYDEVNDLVVDATGAAYFAGSMGLGKISADGVEEWTLRDAVFERALNVALDAEGHVVVVGFATGRATLLGHTYRDSSSFIVRVAPDGKAEWAREILPLRGYATVYGVGATADGKIMVGGITGADAFMVGDGVDADGVIVKTSAARASFVVTYGLDGHAESGITIAGAGGLPPGRSFAFDAAGDVVIAARYRVARALDEATILPAPAAVALSLARYDRAGTLLWHGEVAAASALGTQPGLAFTSTGFVAAGYYPDAATLGGELIDPFDDDAGTDFWLWKVAP